MGLIISPFAFICTFTPVVTGFTIIIVIINPRKKGKRFNMEKRTNAIKSTIITCSVGTMVIAG